LKGTERIIVQQGLLSTTFGYDDAYRESKKKLNDPENEDKVACIFKIHWSDFSYHFILDQEKYSCYSHEYEFVIQDGQEYAVVDCK
jgi:hypothetical protein